jgi:hypothetical protein
MANPKASKSLLGTAGNKPIISEQQSNVPVVVDALDGATFTGDTVTTSATPTVTELEACIGVLAGKINLLIAILEAHGLSADS